MSTPAFFRLDRISVVDVSGADATTIVHNLTTNEVKSLEVGSGNESFVTDIRGKTVAHVHLFREQDCLRMLGPGGQSERIAAHVDRYTIREDATPVVRDDEFSAIVLPREAAEIVGAEFPHSEPLIKSICRIGHSDVDVYQVRWVGDRSALLLCSPEEANSICDALAAQGLVVGDESSFHGARTLAGFPWMGIDLEETNLPQEADRDAQAISFTKGCYLGQETVARLDALGQVQRKLVRWSIVGGVPVVGSTLTSGEKTVGRLTSVAASGEGEAIAIGFARRSHFDPGATATGIIEATGAEFTGAVI